MAASTRDVGMTLIEVLIASAMLAAILFIGFASMRYAASIITDDSDTSTAVRRSREQLDFARLYRNSNDAADWSTLTQDAQAGICMKSSDSYSRDLSSCRYDLRGAAATSELWLNDGVLEARTYWKGSASIGAPDNYDVDGNGVSERARLVTLRLVLK